MGKTPFKPMSLRTESPVGSSLYALCTILSKIASAKVGSSNVPCQSLTKSWLAAMVDFLL